MVVDEYKGACSTVSVFWRAYDFPELKFKREKGEKGKQKKNGCAWDGKRVMPENKEEILIKYVTREGASFPGSRISRGANLGKREKTCAVKV